MESSLFWIVPKDNGFICNRKEKEAKNSGLLSGIIRRKIPTFVRFLVKSAKT